MTHRIPPALAIVALLTASGLTVSGQQPPRNPSSSTPELHVLPVRGNVYMLVGAGANITVSVGREGVLLVDAGSAAMADKVVATINQLARDVTAAPTTVKPCAGFGCAGVMYPSLLATIASPAPPRPIQFIVNTSADADHVGGNAAIARAGTTFGGGPGLGAFAFVKETAMVYAHENVLSRMTADKVATAGLPTESYPAELKQYFNGEGVHLLHQPSAHSDGDSLVHFRGSDVISTGDILSTVSYPTFDVARGGSINGIIDGLNRLLDLVIAEYQTEGGTVLIPGHGRVCDAADLATYRDGMTTLKIEIDNGTQTRLLHLGGSQAPAAEPPSLQGYSSAQWEFSGGRGSPGQPRYGQLKVVTTKMRPGYLRKNGVPYSAAAVLTEYFAHVTDDDGTWYLTVTTMLEDPTYLQQPWVRTSQFRKQPDAKGWNPTPCSPL